MLIKIISTGCNKEYIGQTGGQIRRLKFIENILDNLNMTKKKLQDNYVHLQREYLKFFLVFKMKETNKILRKCYEDHFIKKFKPEINRRL